MLLADIQLDLVVYFNALLDILDILIEIPNFGHPALFLHLVQKTPLQRQYIVHLLVIYKLDLLQQAVR